MTSFSSDSCFSGGNLFRRLDMTDDDDDIVTAAVSLRPFVVALALFGHEQQQPPHAMQLIRFVDRFCWEGGQIVSTLCFNATLYCKVMNVPCILDLFPCENNALSRNNHNSVCIRNRHKTWESVDPRPKSTYYFDGSRQTATRRRPMENRHRFRFRNFD